MKPSVFEKQDEFYEKQMVKKNKKKMR